MIERLKALIINYKKMIVRFEQSVSTNDYNDGYNQGYQEGLELGLSDLEALLEETKIEKEYND